MCIRDRITGSSLSNMITCRFHAVCVCVCGLPADTGIVLQMGTISVYAFISVSYTHLDVYKRQVFQQSGNINLKHYCGSEFTV